MNGAQHHPFEKNQYPCLQKGERIPNSGNTDNARAARIKKTGDYAMKMAPIIEEVKAQGV
jgi:hypothetical protein